MNPEIWGVFHDGSIEAITGSVPGVVELRIDIEYLRDMFDGGGTHLRVRLGGCSRLEYRQYDAQATSDLGVIAFREPEVLSVYRLEPLVLGWREGELERAYDTMEIFLDTGAPLTEEQLRGTCERYWDDWDARRP
ncbi:MAG: hypothetical protein V4850_07820 [Myxococcota bacterium]